MSSKIRTWLNNLRKVIYWFLPAIILIVVFRHIDLEEFKKNLAGSNLWLVGLGIAFYPVVILVGALRWKTILGHYLKTKLPYILMLRHYWIGLALGWFAPASVGWDIYRVVVMGRKYGRYSLNIAAILFEKFMALFTMVLMIVCLYPFIKELIAANKELAHNIIRSAYFVLVFSLVLIAGIALLLRHRAMLMINKKTEKFIAGMLKRVKVALGQKHKDIPVQVSLSELTHPLVSPLPLSQIVILSLAIQVVSAIRNQILFQSLGYDIPLMVNLFLVPICYFVFLLPISFGSLGIREGAYIVLYGIFGVPAEVALLVSFFNLSGILLNNVIGAVLIWHRSPQKHLPEAFAKSCSEK